MKYDIELKESKPKSQWWRPGLILGLVFAFGIISFGCEKCENEPDEYYVKYEAIWSNCVRVIITVNTEDNEALPFTVISGEAWETIIGPVNKGFNATMDISRGNDGITNASIYVTKNESPFALKKTDESETPRNYVQISYTIDY
jgi:hypothetical protein